MIRKLAVLAALLPTIAAAEWLKEATIATSGSTARSAQLSRGLKYIECDQVAYLNFGGSTVNATTSDQRIAQYERYRWVVDQYRYVAAIGSVGNCNIWRSTVGAAEPLPFQYMLPVASPAPSSGLEIQGQGLFSGHTAADTGGVVATATAPASNVVFTVFAWVQCVTYSSGLAQIKVNFTDCGTNTSRSLLVYGLDVSANYVNNCAGAGAFVSYSAQTYCAKASSTINVIENSSGTLTYDIGAQILGDW